MSTTAVYAQADPEIFTILPDFSNHQSGSYRLEPEFRKVIPVSYQPEPKFQLSTGILVLNTDPVIPYPYCRMLI